MKILKCIKCKDFPCSDINRKGFILPSEEINPDKIKIIMISEAPPVDLKDYFYSSNESFYLKTTLQAFNDAGFNISSMEEIIDLGIYITTAIKCAKIRYSASLETIKNCSFILQKEIEMFPYIKVFLLMGDVAIKSINYISKRETGVKVIPNGSTYKIRKEKFYYKNIRVFPSYLQTGKNYLIEKSKRKMISEDIREALSYR